MQRFAALLIDAARPCRHVDGDRWLVDETYVKVGMTRRIPIHVLPDRLFCRVTFD
jgi:transposase-like protein